VGKTKLLSKEEALELVKRSQAGDEEAREILVEKNIRLIWNCVNGFKHRDKEDLFQIGCVAMLYCIDNFDVSRDLEFSTYVATSIKGRIQTYLRDNRIIKIPRPIKDMVGWIVRGNLTEESASVIMEKLELEDNQRELVEKALRFMKEGGGVPSSLGSLFFMDSSGNKLSLEDRIEGDVNGSDWEDSVADNTELQDAINQLKETARDVIHLRYFKHRTQREVAKVLGMTQANVCRVEKKAIKDLKVIMSKPATKQVKTKPVKREMMVIMGTNNKKPVGDREEAIRLLKETEIPANQICKMTGVPKGSIGKLAQTHRPQEVTERIKEKARQESLDKRKVKWVEKPETKPAVTSPRVTELLKQDEELSGITNGVYTTPAEYLASRERVVQTTPPAFSPKELGAIQPITKVGDYDVSVHTFPDGTSGVVMRTDKESPTPKSTTNVEYNFNFNVSGKQVSVDEVITKLDELQTILKQIPVDAVNFRVNVGS
jgi:RNA polymerase sporulation-specific sigma factor